jgi:putative transposase
MSEPAGVKAIGCCRMRVRYKPMRPDDRDLRERMKAIAHERWRFGYRRVHIPLKRARMPGVGGGHLALWLACRSRTG